jgi:very-short-patch-repair endonuclease
MKISKRAFGIKYNFENQWLDVLCASGVIPFEIKRMKVSRIFIDDSIITSLIEGIHFVVCPVCGKKMASITQKHNEVCENFNFKTAYCKLYLENHKKTEKQKKYQSRKLKERFKTPEGDITRKQIGEASIRFNADPIFKKAKSERSKEVQSRPENKLFHSEQSKAMWSDPAFKKRMKKYVKDNIKELQESAQRARHCSKKQSKLHIAYKKSMEEKKLDGFISEYSYGPYSIDEADPLAKIVIEVDGCYWHGCSFCEFPGDSRIKATDKRKNSYLKNRGWVIFRFKEHEIKKDPYVGIEMVRGIQEKRKKAHLECIKNSFFEGFLKVQSMCNKDIKPLWVPISDVMRHHTPHKKMVKVYTELGFVVVTEDHSLFDWLSKEPVRASEIKEGSLIVGLPWAQFEPVKIIKIEEALPEEHTYDVSVPGSENAVLDSGILVHNSYSISGISLDLEKSSKYQAIKDEFVNEYDKLVEQNKASIKIIKGLRQYKFGIGVTSALGPLSRPGVQSRRNLLSA